jgi:hypothetical protein
VRIRRGSISVRQGFPFSPVFATATLCDEILGLIPIVAGRRAATGTSAPHRANLFEMDAKYRDVVGESEVAAHLN